MKSSTFPSSSVFFCVLSLSSAVVPMTANAAAVSVHPASCVAPFLFQAEKIRWHEHFVLNPSTNQQTWVVCPINVDTDFDGESTTYVGASLVRTKGADTTPAQCFFTAHNAINQNLGEFNDGPDYTYTIPLSNIGVTGSVVAAYGSFSPGDIYEDWGPAAADYPPSFSIYCRLPSGWGVNTVVMTDEFSPLDLVLP
jgi:hypothetical protein